MRIKIEISGEIKPNMEKQARKQLDKFLYINFDKFKFGFEQYEDGT